MPGFLEKNILAAAGILERTIATERWSRERGLLQRTDARAKIIFLFLFILLCSLTRQIPVLLGLYIVSVALAALSKINLMDFTRRVWLFIPLFTGVIALPALFVTPGVTLLRWGPFTITRQGIDAAFFLILRVSTSVSFTVLMILTTPWNVVLRALGRMRFPSTVISLLSISYRYLLLLLRTLSELLTARKSRVIETLPYRQELGFLSRSAGYLFLRSLHLAEGVQMAMASRGYSVSGDGSLPAAELHVKENLYAIRGENATWAPPPDAENGREVKRSADRASGSKTGGDNIFRLEKIRYTYPDGVRGVEIEKLDIHCGTCTILLGPNGSGKSTLLKILDGLIFPQKGEVRAFGEILSESRLSNRDFQRSFRGKVGLVFQDADIQCFSPTVSEELAFGPTQKGLDAEEIDRRVREAMSLLKIDSIAGRYPYRLSGGEKKRVAIASVLTIDPEVYLLDEPTANLDPSTEGILIDLLVDLTGRGKTLIVATQDLMLAHHIGDRAIVLGPGKRFMAAGPINEILEDSETLQRAGLAHAHRAPHVKLPKRLRHSHYTEEKGR